MLPKVNQIQNIASKNSNVENYISNRITQAAEKGYSSTYAWVKHPDKKEVEHMLGAGGYSFRVIAEDDSKDQYEIAWNE